jgi:hypothetical protein
MTCLLIGNGYWGSIVYSKLSNFYDLIITANSKSDITKIIDSSIIDIAYVCTPTITHYDIVKKLILKKINVFCEKPFTGDYFKALDLFELSEKNNVKLYVDNIFLFRNEFKSLKENFDLNFKKIEFFWYKFDESKKESIIDSLLYHDLYLLFNLTNDKWLVNKFEIDENILFLQLQQGNKIAEFNYNRNFTNDKLKKITLDNVNFNFSNPKNDPLSETILNITKNNLDYNFNKSTTINVLKFINKIKKI